VPHLLKGSRHYIINRDDDEARLKQVFSILLYCSPGVHSTALPTFGKSEFVLPQFDSSDTILNGADMRKCIENGYWEEDRYQRMDVSVGDIGIFSHGIPHKGTRNPTSLARISLFSILTPFDEKNQDEYQLYRWMYFEKAYGGTSREMAEAVYHGRDHHPLERFGIGPAGRHAKDVYFQNLIRWNYIEYQPEINSYQWKNENEHRSYPLSDEDVLTIYTGKSESVRKRAKKA
jgi:hypothetical protein